MQAGAVQAKWSVAHCADSFSAVNSRTGHLDRRNNNKETSNKSSSVKMVPWCLGRSVMRSLYDEGLFDNGEEANRRLGRMT